MKRCVFDNLSGWLLNLLGCNATIIEYLKHLSSGFFEFIIAFLLATHSGDLMYDFPVFRLVL